MHPLPRRVYQLLLEDGMTKERGLLVPRKKNQDLRHLDHCRDVEVFRQYDHVMLKLLLDPKKALREEESVDVCRDAHHRFVREHVPARSKLFVVSSRVRVDLKRQIVGEPTERIFCVCACVSYNL